MTLTETIGLILVVMAAIGWAKAFDATTAPAYTMSRSKRRTLMRERARLNPELCPTRWRLG